MPGNNSHQIQDQLPYTLEITEKCRKKLTKMCKKDSVLQSSIETFLQNLTTEPYLGDKLEVNFPGMRSIHFHGNKYRII